MISSRMVSKQDSSASSGDKRYDRKNTTQTVSSTRGVKNPREQLILYGNGGDVFRPEFTQVPVGHFKVQLRRERDELELLRPF